MENKNITPTTINTLLKKLPNPSNVLKAKSSTIAIYHKVAEHPDIFSVSQNYKDAICAMNRNCNDEFMQKYMQRYKSVIKQLFRDIVAAREYGYSVIQAMRYEKFMGREVPCEFQLCPHEWFHIGAEMELRYSDSKTGVDGINLMEQYPNKFLWIKNEASLIKPYGISLLDVAYWIAVGLNGNFDAMIEFAEYDGSDKWVGYYRQGATEPEKKELLNGLVTAKANSVAIVPEGSRIELLENKGRGATTGLHKDINEMLLRKIEKLWNGTDLTMQVEGKGGYSSSKTGVDIREDALQLGADLVCEGLGQLYQLIVNINSMTGSNEIEFTLESPRKISKEEAEVDKLYFDMGMKPNQKFFENRGYNMDEFEYAEPSNAANPPSNGNASFGANDLGSIFDLYADNLPK